MHMPRFSNRPPVIKNLIFATALVGLIACAPRYSTLPPLPFAEFKYQGPAGHPWPLAYAELPQTAKAYAMGRAPKIAYVELNPQGQKGTIVFIHGLGSYLKFWYFQLDDYAAQGFHVLALDLPGYGKSEKPATFPYTMEAMADAVRELVAQRGIQNPIVVGHSMGGQTALSWAIRYPSEVRALVLTSPAGFETFSAKEQDWFVHAFSRPLVMRASEEQIWGSIAQGNFYRFRPELDWLIEERVRVIHTPEFEPYAYAQVRSVQGLAHNDLVRTSLGRITAPTLIIFGEDDRLIPSSFLHPGYPRDIFEVGHAGIQGSKLVGLASCGHSVQLDCPSEYGAAVNDFLASLPAAH
jgi:pimeloyl-ACP methyl ester carboxylesterase